ncbi:F-box protein-like protein [Salvia divinorum]|uniref:F-box protein-like protein n=1 Tax=Salvia divinorum TaxID=28513 RepID=A0ABD1GWC8_SALDI
MAGIFLLNEDVVVVILLHLPAKSLTRFKLAFDKPAVHSTGKIRCSSILEMFSPLVRLWLLSRLWLNNDK